MSTTKKGNYANVAKTVLPATAPRMILQKHKLSLGIRLRLLPPKKGRTYTNPHSLQLRITIDGKENPGFVPYWEGEKLQVDPACWNVKHQKSTRRDDPINDRILELTSHIKSIYHNQRLIGIPTVQSIRYELSTGISPEWSALQGWLYPSDNSFKISPNSPLDEAYLAYMAHLKSAEGTANALSPITIGRWKRGLFLLHEFTAKTKQPLPLAKAVTIGWAKRYHTWLQTQYGGRHNRQAISAGQASRFVLKVSTVLTWMIEEGWINDNPIAKVGWPRHEDKEVHFLEPEHVHQLLQLDWQGTKGVALWWFCLMCCTGMDYPDAVAYAQNRKAFEIKGSEGKKIVGRRKKPPHNEYHLPLLEEVEMLFQKYPTGPADISSQCVNRYTDQIEQELGINWRITAKTGRKTYGCLMLAAGHRISDVSLMLGHSSIATTERYYVKVNGASIDRSMKRVKVSISQLVGN